MSRELRDLIFRMVAENPTWGAPRRILHFDATRHPSSAWVIHQLREAFPFDSAPVYLIFDRAAYFSEEVVSTIEAFGIQPKRTGFQSPWQNGVAESWVGSCRRDLLDHVIFLNEGHLKRLTSEYVRYYHEDRTHLALAKGTPAVRSAEKRQATNSSVVSTARLGGLHHRYDLAASASSILNKIMDDRREKCLCCAGMGALRPVPLVLCRDRAVHSLAESWCQAPAELRIQLHFASGRHLGDA